MNNNEHSENEEVCDPSDHEVLFDLHPDWLAEIQRRIAEMDAHPERSIPWEQVHKEALARIAAHVAK